MFSNRCGFWLLCRFIGAEVSADNATLSLLGSNGSACQLFAVSTAGSGGTATLRAVDSACSCSFNLGTGGIAFTNGTAGSVGTDGYIVADSTSVLEV